MFEQIETIKENEKQQLHAEIFPDASKETVASNEAAQPKRRASRACCTSGKSGLSGGMMLVVVGTLLLLSRTTGFNIFFPNWWALFILWPALKGVGEAQQKYRANGGLSRRQSEKLGWSLIMGIVASIFLFNLSWALFVPLMLISIGISTLLGRALTH